MKMALFAIGGCALLALTSGCATYATAVPAKEGKAYVLVNGGMNQKMYYCDKSGGKPVCKELTEEKR